MKTDPRVKTKTQREADKALSEMFQANRGLKLKWVPPKAKIKVKKNKLKIKASVDIDILKLFGIIVLCLAAISLAYYSLHVNFISEPEVRLLPELEY